MEFNNDMDKYLRDRRRSKSFYDSKKSWWSTMFDKPEEIPKDDLSPAEEAKLESIEHDIKRSEAKIEKVQAKEQQLHAAEMELEEEQEDKVSLYQKFRSLFQREHKLEQEYEEVQIMKEQAADPGVTEDFRTMAQIQIRWLERLPTRIKEEFKESEDYARYKDILQRRGVAKK